MVVTYAIPALFFLIFLEYLFCRLKGRGYYLAIDTLSNLAAGILSRLTKPFLKFFSIGVYIIIYENFRLFTAEDLPPTLFYISLVFYFFLIDFCYYTKHRAQHRINFLWGTHIIHHQSENFNLSVAFRQSAISSAFTFIFDLPVALLGLSPGWFVLFNGINLLYQFLIHTETVGKLGFLEIFMNTPSHHRVHHGKNPKYIDKNYAGVFIIWDKLLGTFQAEEETPRYGVTTPPRTFNPITANLHFYQILWQEGKKQSSFAAKLALWFQPPERIYHTDLEKSEFVEAYHRGFRLPNLLPISMFYVVVTVLTFAMLLFSADISPIYLCALLLIIMTDLPFRIFVNRRLKREAP